MAGPLRGYRILDLTALISGPYGTQLLGDQGADIVKVEPVGSGDLFRHGGVSSAGMSSHFAANNRSKRSLALDLTDARGKALLERLIPSADVFVQNFRPEAIERMGFGESQVRALRPDIIYVSIFGFGETGPLAGKRVYDALIQALAGIMRVQGIGREPMSMNTMLPDKLTAMTWAQAATAALLERERSGKGQHVRISMLDAAIAWMWPDSMLDDIWITDELSDARASERNMCFKTADDYIATCILSDSEYEGFCRAAERPDLLEHPEFSQMAGRALTPNFFALLREVLAQRPTRYWLEAFAKHDVPVAPLLTPFEVVSHPQVVANELVYERQHPHAARIREVRPAARFDRTRLERGRPVPLLGEHSREILAEVGVDAAAFEALVADKVVQGV